jgi:hypothetical protein
MVLSSSTACAQVTWHASLYPSGTLAFRGFRSVRFAPSCQMVLSRLVATLDISGALACNGLAHIVWYASIALARFTISALTNRWADARRIRHSRLLRLAQYLLVRLPHDGSISASWCARLPCLALYFWHAHERWLRSSMVARSQSLADVQILWHALPRLTRSGFVVRSASMSRSLCTVQFPSRRLRSVGMALSLRLGSLVVRGTHFCHSCARYFWRSPPYVARSHFSARSA